MLKKGLLAGFQFLFFTTFLFCQDHNGLGILTGNIMDTKSKPVVGATVQLASLADTSVKKIIISDKTGEFQFSAINFGFYKLSFSYVGLQTLTIDSIHFRTERYDFNLSDIIMQPSANEMMDAVVIYAEKPLIESKDGNITFNAGESATAAGSNASDLLTQVPLVSKDADGKITVRGKEPKILIDDKPVELNLDQLQDLLESMPGSSIEKIEVMTNPPPQYASEQGGVINIVTKKGKVGKSGRISVSAGTRREASVSTNFSYRKKGFAISINAGINKNQYIGNGYSVRNNIYADSANFFNTINNSNNKSWRPSFRVNIDYDFNKNNLLNVVVNFNQNNYDNVNLTTYKNINRFDELWKLSQRSVASTGVNNSPGINLSYTKKGKPGETFKIITNWNFASNTNNRIYYQEYFNPDNTPKGQDSLQNQDTRTSIDGHVIRLNYDKMLDNKKTFLSVGSYYSRSNNHVIVDASYLKKPEGTMEPLDILSNDFWFHQTVSNVRASMKQIVGENFSFTIGSNVEKTNIWFELLKESKEVKNDYTTWLPFANINKTWKEKLSITMAYRRSVRRPGIGELNPTIDFSDPYNTRFGNPYLVASTADNFDLIFSRTKSKYFLNLGMGYNIVKDVFSRVRTLLEDGKTQITWENISDRKEYEISTWNGLTLTRKLKLNASVSYTYSQYSDFDKTVRKFRDGGSFTSTVGGNFTPVDLWSFNGNFNLNKFASPQGYARWNTSLKIGVQRKLFNKRLIITLNAIDPFANQQRKTFTYGPNFNLESFSLTQTRNYRLTVAYNFITQKKKPTPKISSMLKGA